MSQIHVHLHDNPIYKLGPVHVGVRGVGGESKVEVGEDAACLSHSSHSLHQDLPWGPLGVQNEMASGQAELGLNGLVVRVCVQELQKVVFCFSDQTIKQTKGFNGKVRKGYFNDLDKEK